MNKDRELNLLVDLESGRIWVPKMGTHLTPSEIRLLAVLNRREGRPTPLEFLINELNRDPAGSGGGNPRYHIFNLRRKLEHTREQPVIITRPGIGYYLVPGRVHFIGGADK
ncbi:MAG: helix-turn-helix domain-containing protein [Syntrophomonadaceae bacterium]|nr:helix-turn-helix domain-containing protein [Syntrophomonadaceae bacterium]